MDGETVALLGVAADVGAAEGDASGSTLAVNAVDPEQPDRVANATVAASPTTVARPLVRDLMALLS